MRHLINCENPKVIKNPYTNEYMTVPCNYCDACKMSSAFIWSQRIEHECLSSQNSLFVTLTYNNECVPKMNLELNSEHAIYYYKSGLSAYHRPFEDGEYFDLNVLGKLSDKDYNYIIDSPNLMVLSKRHCQLFIKRLRRNIEYRYGKDAKLRYYICGEYGPSTFRPHYHLILWFPSVEDLSEKIVSLVSSCWPYGFTDSSFVRNSCSDYVAKYVNCTSYLPKVYQSKLIKPFFLCSKCPPIGFNYESVAKIPQEIVFGNTTFKGVQRCGKQFVDIPNWRSVESTLYPKISRFSRLSNLERITIYGCASISGAETKYTFKAWCKGQISSFVTPFTQYLQSIGIQSYGKILTEKERNIESSAAFRLFSISRRVLYWCRYLGFSLSDYINIIDRYYFLKEQRRLREWFIFQNDYINSGGDLKDLLLCDLAFPKRVISSYSRNLICQSYGYDSFSHYQEFDLTKTLDYQSMCSFYHKLSHDSHKVKKANDKYNILHNKLFLAQSRYRFNYG